MATINNSEIQKRIISEAKIQTSIDKVPTQLAEKVVPVLISNPKQTPTILKRSASDTSGTSIIYTTPKNHDFYLTYAMLSSMDDSASDNVKTRLQINIKGSTNVALIEHRSLSLVADNSNTAIEFTAPILLERNSSILVSNVFSVGNSTKTGIIAGYIIE